ncbi:MAG: prolyl oligopeptidase family serine peptidase, partial [Acidobacteria bacterium]|nr:prolyl oligopeptidase family serine peptidase [Acidobacteriota bacterium]
PPPAPAAPVQDGKPSGVGPGAPADTPPRVPLAAPASPIKPSPLGARRPQARGVAQAERATFEVRSYRTPDGAVLPYRLFMPDGYDPKRKYPLILVLHGASSRGHDNQQQLSDSDGPRYWASAQVQTLQQAFVVAPQADPQYSPTWVRAWRPPVKQDPKRPEPLELSVDLIEDLSKEFSIDRSRLYVVGYSMGGFGAWLVASRHPDLFAAVVPIAGGGDPSYIVGTSAEIWAFHGTTDKVVPVRRSRQMVAALKKAGKDVKYTEYPGVNHKIWRLVYQEAELPVWLFKQSR